MISSLLIFGGGPLQLSIIGVAKEMGFNTIVIDPDPIAPGKEIAHEFYAIEGNDFEGTLEIAKKHNVRGIVTAATDKPILMMCNIAKELNLPFPSYESCNILLDKAKFKEFLKLNKLPHAKGIASNGDYHPNQMDISYPLIVKPVTNSGSRGVIKVLNLEELPNAIGETLKHSKDERFLIEEYVEGDEISVEALIQHGVVHIVQITDKIVSEPPYNVELGHIQPSKYHYLNEKIKDILQIIVDKIGLNNCALHPEFKIKDDNITIIEIGPRLGGDFITSHLVKLSTGSNIEQQIIKLSVGEEITYSNNKMASLISYLNLPVNGEINKVFSECELKETYPEIVNFHLDLKKGEKIRKITNSLDRYGYVIVSGKTVESILKVLDKIISNLVNNLIS